MVVYADLTPTLRFHEHLLFLRLNAPRNSSRDHQPDSQTHLMWALEWGMPSDQLKRVKIPWVHDCARSRPDNGTLGKEYLDLGDFTPKIKAQYRTYEEVFFRKIKDELVTAREHPAMAGGIGIAAGLLLMRGPRRFLFRQTLGRLQSEEAKFSKAEKNVKELNVSVDLMKKESKKLLERAALAEKDMKSGHSDLMVAGNQIQSVAKSVYKVEAQAADLMDVLREIPGREALKLRAEVASMASHLRQQRTAIDKRIVKISELGLPI
ncbi:hypothetical protein RND71_040489 [Anisodus tanguticus]|uniref:Uncharacterized protein n=1 Tax=Anisodus tanguticus TaxID=243964 RepID=A0AAE1QVQ6_9SOLA|nr:hypothetical protein RND71_040489 [Anisodus tanguticus]